MLLELIIVVSLQIQSILSQGCTTWSGKSSGYLKSGPCPSPGANGGPFNCTQTPTYQQTQELGNLWPCPDGNNSALPYICNSAIESQCKSGNTSEANELCTGFNFSNPDPGCCCNLPGCSCQAEFNWIIGTCQGIGCGAYSQQNATQKYKDLGSQVVVNYIASYIYDNSSQQWHIMDSSSFNTDAKYPPFDLVKPYGGLTNISEAWISPQPGGAAAWTWGYYPAGVKGIGPPAAMFILSTDQSFNLAWYMLNQLTLDRGPAVPYPSEMCDITNNNCWAAGNAGEFDFLENPWAGNENNGGAADDYRRMFSTQSNQVGRCFPGEKGQTGTSFGSFASNNYFLGSPPNTVQPWIWVAVVDKIGTFMYRIPGDKASDIWPGLTRTTAECTLQQRPLIQPPNNGPPCDDSYEYCATFIPNCPADKWGGENEDGAMNQGCWQNPQQGFCNNWWTLFDDTNQWLWPKNGTKAVTNWANANPVTQKWNYEMESKWQNN
eukprot:470897_1